MRHNPDLNTVIANFKYALKLAKSNLKVIQKTGISDKIANELAHDIYKDMEFELKRFKEKWEKEWDKTHKVKDREEVKDA